MNAPQSPRFDNKLCPVSNSPDMSDSSYQDFSSVESRIIHLIRHGESLHKYVWAMPPHPLFIWFTSSSIDRGYAHRDPPLTELGETQAKAIHLRTSPDLIILSPMTRVIRTAILAFPDLLACSPPAVAVQVWPDLREAHDAICNKGVSRVEIAAKFPHLDFSECSADWEDYPPHTIANAEARAERVRKRLQELPNEFKSVALITHRGFLAFLVQGKRFGVGG